MIPPSIRDRVSSALSDVREQLYRAADAAPEMAAGLIPAIVFLTEAIAATSIGNSDDPSAREDVLNALNALASLSSVRASPALAELARAAAELRRLAPITGPWSRPRLQLVATT